MGTFRTDCVVENILNRKKSAKISGALVDTGAEFSWVPTTILERIGVNREKKDRAFTNSNGQQVTRSVGFAIVRVGKEFTVDEVVFAEPGDLSLLAARTLEGLSLVVDPGHKKLVASGPLPAAASRRARD